MHDSHVVCLKVMRTFAAFKRHITHVHNGKQPKTARRGGEKVPYKRSVRPRGSSRAAKQAAAAAGEGDDYEQEEEGSDQDEQEGDEDEQQADEDEEGASAAHTWAH